MAKKRRKDNEENSILQRLRKKVRVVVVNMETYEERRHFITSAMNMLTISLFAAILLITITYVVVAYTPVKRTIPGYPSYSEEQSLKKLDLQNLKYMEELGEKSEVETLYYKNIQAILNEQKPFDPTVNNSIGKMDSIDIGDISFEITEKDSILREKIDEREKYALSHANIIYSQNDDLKGVFLFPPLNGSVSNSINVAEGHFGVDIIAPKDEAVKAILDGTIVFTDWSPENGYIIHVQHNHNLLSIYKHNSFILKKNGDIVEAGEPIAIIGNTGELSSGTHLHFELWHKGVALNPEDFITF